MQLNKLPKTTTRKKKRVGRGYGSGKGGHTVGRGAKGTKARSKIKPWFEGGQTPLFKRLPMKRGKDKFKAKPKPITLNVKFLNLLPQNTQVNINSLIKQGLVDKNDAKTLGVKILGGGDLKVALKVALPCSKGAEKKIKKAGGKLEKLT
jgi:large subunit ribosomal protein L15